MHRFSIDLPERLAQEIRQLVDAGWFADERELGRLALLELVARYRPLLQGGAPLRREERKDERAPRGADEKAVRPAEAATRRQLPPEPRIQTVFRSLLHADAGGGSWLPGLLSLASRNREYASRLADKPGELIPGLLHPRPRGPRTLELCFERAIPPPEAFLRWLIQNPDQVTWPDDEAVWNRFKPDVRKWRRQLQNGDDAVARQEAQRAALSELGRLGVDGSRQAWWAFEGFTPVDVWLETDDLLLFLEDRRNGGSEPATRWYPARSRLLRILEAAQEMAPAREFALLVVADDETDPVTAPAVEQSYPHLPPEAREKLLGHYLGVLPWDRVAALAEPRVPGP